jgi:hypothetical protein
MTATRTLLLVLLLATLPASGCYDVSDACRDYCVMAADCLDCGGAVDVAGCQDECEGLSFDQQKALATCADDCANVSACRSMVGFMPPNPCAY